MACLHVFAGSNESTSYWYNSGGSSRGSSTSEIPNTKGTVSRVRRYLEDLMRDHLLRLLIMPLAEGTNIGEFHDILRIFLCIFIVYFYYIFFYILRIHFWGVHSGYVTFQIAEAP